MNNSLSESKPKFSVTLASQGIQNLINNTYKDPAVRNAFIANVSSVVANNPDLQKCDHTTIITACMVAINLKLPLSNALSFCYVLPFKDNKNGRNVATFVLSYKGMIQLAIRSGQYKLINVCDVKEGELVGANPFDGTFELKAIANPLEREKAKTIGYYAVIELVNGFRKEIYNSVEMLESHANKFSPSYRRDKEKGWNSSYWSKNFDDMCKKTMIRKLLSGWGIMSTEMETAFDRDNTFQENAAVSVVTETDIPLRSDNPHEDEKPENTSEVVETPTNETQEESSNDLPKIGDEFGF